VRTGPSATAEIEGVLIQRAQGVRTVLPISRPEGLAPTFSAHFGETGKNRRAVFASGALLLWQSRGTVSVHYKSNY
jgi:hypothetical protein